MLTAAVGLGIVLALLYLRGISGRKPAIGILHGILGAVGFALLLVTLQGPRRGEAMGVGSFGISASVLIGIALVMGPLIPILSRRSPLSTGAVMATHASLAVAGFLMFLAWWSNG